MPSEEFSRFRVPDLDRELPVPAFDVAGLQPPIELHGILRFELRIVGIAVVNAPDRVIFTLRRLF